MDDQLDDAARERALPFLTTEHFTLQTARSATIADSSSRASLFMSTVSSSLVALAFVGQIAGLESAFYAFAFILLPTLCFLGIVTFIRTLESTIEELFYARGIGRIRRFYLEMVPQTRDYFIMAAGDDNASTLGNMGLRPSRLRVFVTTAGIVSIITSVLIGVLIGLIIQRLLAPSLTIAVGCGVATFLIAASIFARVQQTRLEAADRQIPVKFPSTDNSRKSKEPNR